MKFALLSLSLLLGTAHFANATAYRLDTFLSHQCTAYYNDQAEDSLFHGPGSDSVRRQIQACKNQLIDVNHPLHPAEIKLTLQAEWDPIVAGNCNFSDVQVTDVTGHIIYGQVRVNTCDENNTLITNPSDQQFELLLSFPGRTVSVHDMYIRNMIYPAAFSGQGFSIH
jgi:hypothetical protein